ncbi:hypothetical protein NDI37_14495 [Funiculus sociatus GB2-A5]|uniref:O-antigen polysaccharide polymerase Wzy n=1 Tax=Funiculus sociatus GB2-A5 TaxID=2933946 RepID=A0ABV0JQD7_9CYAN|nr:hypothetical protein [Trichocoleus sp. FACHB-6]MBD2061876.1 hypothetical protein [Trichocoleus sp. FACHB-6]
MPLQSSRSPLLSRQAKKYHLLILPFVLVAITLLCIVFFPSSIPSGDRWLIFADGLGICILCSWAFLRSPLQSIDIFKPQLLYRAIIFVYYGLPTILFASSGSYGPDKKFTLIFVRNAEIAKYTATYLFLFTLVTLVAFDIGVKISQKSLGKIGWPLNISSSYFKWLFSLYLLLVIPIRSFQVFSGAYIFETGVFNKIPAWWALLNYPAILITFVAEMYCLILAYAPRYRTFARLSIAVLMFSEQYLVAFVSSSKQSLLLVTLNLLLVLRISQAISFFQIILLTTGTALVFAPLTLIVRYMDVRYLRSLNLFDALSFVGKTMVDTIKSNYFSIGDYLALSITSLSKRTDGFRTAARSIDIAMNHLEPAGGATVMAGFYNLVPSFLWPERNELTRNVVHFTTVFFDRTGEDAHIGIAISQAAEWYYNFGYYGGLIACAVFALSIGFILGAIYGSPEEGKKNNLFFFGLVIYLPIATQFLFLDLPLFTSLANGIRYTIIGAIFYFLLSITQKKTQ